MEKNKKHSKDNHIDHRAEATDISDEGNNSQEMEQPEVAEPLLTDAAIEKLKAEVEEQKDKYVRLFAEFDNYKRRTSKERIELIQTAGREVITSMLQVLDDCDRAEKQMQETNDPAQIIEGVQLVFNKLRRT